MEPSELTRRAVLGAVGSGVAVGLAGCTGDGGDETGEPQPTGRSGDQPTDGATAGDVVVEVRTHEEYGDVLTDAEGLTLYMFDSDTNGESASTCYEGCAETWPPMTTDGAPEVGDGVSAELSTFERDGGQQQVAANGWPLYYFAPDESPGDASGQGVNDVWWVLSPNGTPRRSSASGSDEGNGEDTDDSGGASGSGGIY